MKNLFKYILTCLLFGSIIISCALKEEVFLPETNKDSGTRLVTAFIQDFSRHDVSTKASVEQESKVENLALLVYATPSEGGSRVLITDPLFVYGEMLNFVINTTDIEGGQYIANIQDAANPKYFSGFDGDLSSSRIYIVANLNSVLNPDSEKPVLTTEDDLLNIGYTVLNSSTQGGSGITAIDVPGSGFPMLGWADIDLSPQESTGAGAEQSLTVYLKKLFAKVNVKFLVQLNMENVPGEVNMVKTPYFAPIEWSVHNIPTTIDLMDEDPAIKPTESVFSTQNFTSFNFSTETSRINKRIENSTSGNEYFDFSFYVPEYKVLPANNTEDKPYKYPDRIDDNSKQFFKPDLCDLSTQYPMYVLIKGRYSNHQGHISEVEYKLYLGQNETDDFQILRNQELNNTAIITGLTNYSGGTGISVDLRVDIKASGYSIAMERETLLDSHFEFRPMDISVQEGAVVVVKIPRTDENGNNINRWFVAENRDARVNNGDVYDSTKPGLRKFFTSGLLSELGNTQYKEYVFIAEDNGDDQVDQNDFRLWFYFDENVSSPYDPKIADSENNKLYREGMVYVDFYENFAAYENATPTTKDREFTFRQLNLWTIHADINDYNIEYFEEYLYNYASDDNYGVTTDGMPWGLNDDMLSTKYPAIYIDKGDVGGWGEWLLGGLFGFSFQGIMNELFSEVDEKYDFYLSRDNVSQSRDYAGLAFTKEIVSEAGIGNNVLTLSGNAQSAVEYCYNKNKRNNQGKVEDVQWYLPAIDETEEILVDGFDYFDVFQSKYYWSSQPAFNKHNFNASSSTTSMSGAYYSDDRMRARATIVTETTTSADSGVDGAIETVPFTVNVLRGEITPGTPTPSTQTPHDGNKLRTDIHRVRCAYASGGRPHVFGNYSVRISTRASGNNPIDVDVTINKSDDPTKGNVMLSNYIHNTYNEIGYPQYAEYDKSTQILTIKMGQVVGVEERSFFEGGDRTHSSVLYNADQIVQDGTLTLKYDSSIQSFTLVGNSVNLRTNYSTGTGYYIISFTRSE